MPPVVGQVVPAPRLTTMASVRDHTTGGWSSKVICLGHHHVYVVESVADVACQIRWSISLNAATVRVEAVESDPLAFKVVPDTSSKMSYMPPNSSASGPQRIKPSSPKQRDEWVRAIQAALETQDDDEAYMLNAHDVHLPVAASVGYFGALQTGRLGSMWGAAPLDQWANAIRDTNGCAVLGDDMP
ncbi:hypothetical protein DYB32_009139 [Aphanomyces invadans]|uniref:PH domain-containing protein n=1 Tax=Aphanomyces invadans TaxID=157072 RepID=A0A3R6VHM1_9STRA|nr:hypothetical protein DYB32_009139 [Aphanomyces invadans]